jgi:HlyD family secretion protein
MYIEIVEGLKEGDEVISGPYRAVSKKLEDGQEVRKVKRKELFSEE